MILVIAFGAAIVSAIISFFFMTPIYQSSTQILVNQKKQEGSMFQAGEVQTNIQLTNTYKVIIKSPVILEQVNEKLNLNMTAQALTKKINVANEKDSQVISVTAEDKDPKVARDVANATADVFKGEVAKIMNVDNVTVLSKAEVAENQSPIKPRPMLNVAIAFVVGLMASVGLAFLLEYLDNTVKKEEDVENLLGLPVLGIVARMDEETMNVKSHAPSSRKVRGQTIGS
ncbi:Wzz/FepE/Etk N-terminal domain-containing protein [Bacillus anthracis]